MAKVRRVYLSEGTIALLFHCAVGNLGNIEFSVNCEWYTSFYSLSSLILRPEEEEDKRSGFSRSRMCLSLIK